MIIKYKKYLILAVLFSLLLPQISYAAAPAALAKLLPLLSGVGGKLEQVFEPVIVQMLTATLILGLSMFVLMFFISTLEFFIEKQTVFLEQLLPVTQAAFDFVVGIANMFVILILVVIAFAFILKIETLQAKKTLPRLIIVALFMNFSLLFVNMLIDLSQVIYNTILAAGGIDLLLEAFGMLLGKAMNLLLGMYITVTALFALMGAPKIATAIIAIVGFLAPLVIIPMLIFVLFVAGFAFLLAAPIALLAFLFAARIFVLQILGIVAPLAFLCLVLPQTKKHFDEWLSHLVEWLMLGIVGLFLLSIAFGIIGFLQADIDLGFTTLLKISVLPLKALFTWQNPIRLLFEMHSSMYLYFFGLFVYMCIVSYILAKNMPAIANTLITQGKGLMGNLWSMGVKPFASAAWRQTKKTAAESEDVQRIAERMATSRTPELRGWRRLATPFVAPFHMATRGIGRAIGPGAVDEQRKQIAAAEKELAGQTTASQYSAYLSGNEARQIGALNAIIKDSNLDSAMDLGLDNNQIQTTRISAERYDTHREIVSARPDLEAQRNNDVANRHGISPAEAYAQTIPNEPNSGIIARIRPHRAGQISNRVFNNPDVMEAIIRSWDGRHMAKFIDSHGRAGVMAIETAINGLGGMDALQAINPQLHRFIEDTAGRRLGFSI